MKILVSRKSVGSQGTVRELSATFVEGTADLHMHSFTGSMTETRCGSPTSDLFLGGKLV